MDYITVSFPKTSSFQILQHLIHRTANICNHIILNLYSDFFVFWSFFYKDRIFVFGDKKLINFNIQGICNFQIAKISILGKFTAGLFNRNNFNHHNYFQHCRNMDFKENPRIQKTFIKKLTDLSGDILSYPTSLNHFFLFCQQPSYKFSNSLSSQFPKFQ